MNEHTFIAGQAVTTTARRKGEVREERGEFQGRRVTTKGAFLTVKLDDGKTVKSFRPVNVRPA